MENKVTVEIFGEKYALKGDLKAEKVLKLAAIVDKKMRTVAKLSSDVILLMHSEQVSQPASYRSGLVPGDPALPGISNRWFFG